MTDESSPVLVASGAASPAGARPAARGLRSRGREELLQAAGPSVAWLAGLVVCLALHSTRAYLSAAIWGLLLLASFVSWGAALVGALSTESRFGWGLEGSVGLALSLFVFADLACVHMVSAPAVVMWSAAGPIALAAVRLRTSRTPRATVLRPPLQRALTWLKRRPSLTVGLGLAVLGTMAALQYVQAVADTNFNIWDDNEAYRAFARQLLETGSIYDPFSYRRASAYSGQSIGHAMVLALADRERLHIFDGGICLLLLLGLVTGFRSYPRAGAWPAIATAGLFALTLLFTPHNLASELSGAVFFLALFRLLDDPHFRDAPPRLHTVLAGLMVAAVCSLRQNYMPMAVGFVGLHYLSLAAFPPAGTERRAWLVHGAAVLGAVLVCILPWVILSIASTGTPFFPVIRGNVFPGYGFVGRCSWAEFLRWALANLLYAYPLGTTSLLFLAGFLLPANGRTRALHALLFSSVGGFALMMYFFQGIDAADSIGRYYFAFVVAYCIAVSLRAFAEVSATRRAGGALAAAASVAVALGLHLVAARDTIRDVYQERITALDAFVRQRGPGVRPTDVEGLYRRVQESVPPGQSILVMVDHAYFLDWRRNRLFLDDLPASVAPGSVPPNFEGPEALAKFLHGLGIRYVAYTWGPPSPEYQWEFWQHRFDLPPSPNGRGDFYKNTARFELDFFKALLAFHSSRKIVFHEAEMTVLDLETPAS